MVASKQKTIEIPAVKGSNYADKTVKVIYDDKDVIVNWLCGGTYQWTKETLATELQSFEVTGTIPDAFFHGGDDKAKGYYARLINKKNFTADETITDTITNVMAVDWSKFRAALYKALDKKPPKAP